MRLFNRVTLATPESVDLEFNLAGIGNRALALVIDYHILGATLVTFWVLWFVVAMRLLEWLSNFGGNYSLAPAWLLAILLLVSFTIFVGYFVFFELTWQGQTPGKRFAKIRVIQDNGKPITLAQAVLRSLLRPIDDFFFLGVFFIVLGPREKRIGDLVAGTLVVQEYRPDAKKPLFVTEVASDLATTLPHISQINRLLPDEFAVIREYLQRRTVMTARARADLSLDLARKIKALIQLEEMPEGLTAEQFLEAVYLAYQHQSGDTSAGSSMVQ